MIKITGEVVIDAPVGDVFAIYVDHETAHHWQHNLVKKTAHDGHARVKGARVTDVHNFHGRKVEYVGTVTEYEENRLYGFTGSGKGVGGIHYENHFEPARGGQATRMRAILELDPPDLLGLARPLIQKSVQRDMDHTLATLKDHVEMAAQKATLHSQLAVHDHHR